MLDMFSELGARFGWTELVPDQFGQKLDGKPAGHEQSSHGHKLSG
jgi:hypothetical protein